MDAGRVFAQRELELDRVELLRGIGQKVGNRAFRLQVEHRGETASLQIEIDRRDPHVERMAKGEREIARNRGYAHPAGHARNRANHSVTAAIAAPARFAYLEQRARRLARVEREEQYFVRAGPKRAPHQIVRSLRQQRKEYRPRGLRRSGADETERVLLGIKHDHLHVRRGSAIAAGREARLRLHNLDRRVGQRRKDFLEFRP
jgi:hypothetical protein